MSYPASRRFSLAWLLAFTKSFVWLVCGVHDSVYVPPRNGKRGVLTKSMAQQTSHANNFVNAKSSAREKLLLAGYGFPSIFLRAQPWKHYGARLNYYAFNFFFCSYILCSNALYNCYTVCVLQDNEHIFDCVLDCASIPRSFVRRPDVLETRHKVRDALLCLPGKT